MSFFILTLLMCVQCVWCEDQSNSTAPEIITAAPSQDFRAENVTRSNHTSIQPSQSQTQEVNLKVPAILNISAKADVSKSKDFRPSPHLETYYEYNKFPVVPALPEPKVFGSVEKVPIHSTQQQQQSYDQKPDVWSTKVRFPSSQPITVNDRPYMNNHPITVNDHPYPYTKDIEKSPSSSFYGGYNYKEPTVIPQSSYDQKYSSYGDIWDKTLKRKPSKTFYETEPMHSEMMENPWKKILKMLVAVIPIGLLISALTPSVITISSTNGTSYGRSLSHDTPDNLLGLGLLKQLNVGNCDERIFCELLLSAEESGNSEKDVEGLLDNYMQGKGNTEKLSRIYKAIKSGNCSSLHCESIKDN